MQPFLLLLCALLDCQPSLRPPVISNHGLSAALWAISHNYLHNCPFLGCPAFAYRLHRCLNAATGAILLCRMMQQLRRGNCCRLSGHRSTSHMHSSSQLRVDALQYRCCHTFVGSCTAAGMRAYQHAEMCLGQTPVAFACLSIHLCFLNLRCIIKFEQFFILNPLSTMLQTCIT